mgnify:CR=1 FL=1|tara:strand:+ start:228 stop:935 length:708 start_codon:yes stop_codon:yes gene_type:complete
MKKIVILTTDTLHHRYFINYLLESVILSAVIVENNVSHAEFETGPLYENKEKEFELKHFFDETPNTLPTNILKNVKSVNDQISIETLKKINPDFGIVFGTGRISEDIINLFKDGLINVHRGVVEKYRGLDSDLWAIYHNDYKNIGVTIHQVFPELDTGNIVFSEKMPLKINMKVYQIRYVTTVIASKLVQKSIFNYLNSNLNTIPQKKLGRYYSYMPLVLKKIVLRKFNNYCKNL